MTCLVEKVGAVSPGDHLAGGQVKAVLHRGFQRGDGILLRGEDGTVPGGKIKGAAKHGGGFLGGQI